MKYNVLITRGLFNDTFIMLQIIEPNFRAISKQLISNDLKEKGRALVGGKKKKIEKTRNQSLKTLSVFSTNKMQVMFDVMD